MFQLCLLICTSKTKHLTDFLCIGYFRMHETNKKALLAWLTMLVKLKAYVWIPSIYSNVINYSDLSAHIIPYCTLRRRFCYSETRANYSREFEPNLISESVHAKSWKWNYEVVRNYLLFQLYVIHNTPNLNQVMKTNKFYSNCVLRTFKSRVIIPRRINLKVLKFPILHSTGHTAIALLRAVRLQRNLWYTW